jgi:nucleoside-diphosphate-sugar epimerase
MRIAPAVITGARGFVGRALLREIPGAIALPLSGEDWRAAIAAAPLAGATVFHLAARTHQQADAEAFERDNVEKTRVLAEAAARSGARRIVYLGTVKVHGEETRTRPFRASDPASPVDAYARSKWHAEEVLRAIARDRDLRVVIVRAPLVFGPGAPANLRALVALADTPLPLPFASIRNRRTLVHVDDLARLLCACADAPAPPEVLLAGDPDSVSTPRLVRVLRAALGRPARLFALPAPMLEAAALPLGRVESMRRLTRSLELDVSETLRSVEWKPRVSIEEGMAAMARAHRGGAP